MKAESIVFAVAFYTSLAGGVLAIVLMVKHRYGRQAMRNLWLLVTHWRVSGIRPLDALTIESSAGPKLPYALPTAVGGTPEIITDGVEGLLVPPRDTEALADALITLLRDPAQRAEMGKRGRARVMADFTPRRPGSGAGPSTLPPRRPSAGH